VGRRQYTNVLSTEATEPRLVLGAKFDEGVYCP
jgi:hypothetical protein